MSKQNSEENSEKIIDERIKNAPVVKSGHSKSVGIDTYTPLTSRDPNPWKLFLWGLLGFILPPVGITIGILWWDKHRVQAKANLIGSGLIIALTIWLQFMTICTALYTYLSIRASMPY